MAGFLDLPAELIPSILAYVADEDLKNVRLASRFTESSSLAYFGRRFFRKKGYLITSPSLNVLKSVSQHVGLRKHVQHVWFNPDLFTFITPECAPEPDFRYALLYGTRSDADDQKYDVYQDCMHDHRGLLYTSNLQDVLTQSFSGLPNLQAIGMRRSEDHQPWGWSKLHTAIGEDPRVLGSIPSGPMSSLSGPTYLFMAIVKSLAASKITLKRLYTDAIEIDNIRPDILRRETLEAAFKSLLYLEINASKAWLTQKAKHSVIPSPSQYGDGLVKLLNEAPKLRELGLQIFRDLRQSYMVPPTSRDPETWRESYPYLTFRKLADSVHLAFLRRLKLEKLITTPDILIQFLRSSRASLQSLKIRDVRLLSSDDNKRPWRPVFEFLRDHCDKLSFILLYHLMYDSGGVSFVERPPLPTPYLATDDMTGAPNPPYGEPAGGELFTKDEHIATTANGRDMVAARLHTIVDQHWYQHPLFSYAMDELLWHTDTSDDEW